MAFEIGELVKGKGIYIGVWKPRDKKGNSLGDIFNVFAALEDLKDDSDHRLLLTFSEAVERVARLQGYHGHDGFDHEVKNQTPDGAFYEALRAGNYKGGWVIPPAEILAENIYENRDVFRPENSLAVKNRDADDSNWYWSCTEHANRPFLVHNQKFTDGARFLDRKFDIKISTRLVRFEPVPS